ncbi:hypothetical protein GcM3_201043, partial [Golovinomyces cichoracearum]
MKNAEMIALLLQKIITKAAEKVVPRYKPSSHSKARWNADLTRLRQQYHSLRRKAKKTQQHKGTKAALVARNSYFRSISHTKSQHWYDFLASAKDQMIFKAYQYSNYSKYQSSLILTL